MKKIKESRLDDPVCPAEPAKSMPFSMVPANAQWITFDDPSYVDLWRPSGPNWESLPPEALDYVFRGLIERAQQTTTEEGFRRCLADLIEYEGVTAKGYRLLAAALRQGLQRRRGRPKIDDRVNNISLRYFGLSGEFYPSDPKPRADALRDICREYSVGEQEASRLYARAKKWADRPGVLLHTRSRKI